MSLVPPSLLYDNHKAQCQSNSAYDVLWKKDVKNAVKLIGIVKTPGKYGDIFDLNLIFSVWNKSLRAAKENVKDGETDFKREKKKFSEKFEMIDQMFL